MASESLISCRPYFVIFASIKEPMTLNLAQRSFKVIHFGGNRKPVYGYIYINGLYQVGVRLYIGR